MTYVEILKKVAESTEYPQKICEVVCDTLFEEIAKGIQKDEIVKLKHFGTFYLYECPPKHMFDVSILQKRIRPPVKKLRQRYSNRFKSIVYGKEVIDDEDE